MKNIQDELKKLASEWNASGEHDGTEFEGRFFIGDDELDEFAVKHNLTREEDGELFFDEKKIMSVCDCRFDCDYDGNHGGRNFSESEVIFNDL